MTSANVFHQVQPVSTPVNANAATGKKNNLAEVAALFASMMNAGYSAMTETPKAPERKLPDHSENVNVADSTVEFERYSYKSTEIAQTDTAAMPQNYEELVEEVEEFEQEVTQAIAQMLGVSEEDVVQAMDELGFLPLQLLEPQNLTNLTMKLTGSEDAVSLLTDPKFTELFAAVEQLGTQVADVAGIRVEELNQLVGELMPVTDEIIADSIVLPEPTDQEVTEIVVEPERHRTGEETSDPEQAVTVPEQMVPAEQAPAEKVQIPETVAAVKNTEAGVVFADKITADAVPESEQKQWREAEVRVPVTDETQQQAEESPMSDFMASSQNEDSAGLEGQPDAKNVVLPDELPEKPTETRSSNEPVVLHTEHTQMTPDPTVAEPVIPEEQGTYTSVDTANLIEQVVEQMKISTSENLSQVEMQLNPENLGKVLVHITSKEGTIHAQLTASNEEVRSALEAQVATLRENLNQAGVKVDAIEVTVASHEFERNLEQNEKREEQQAEQAQELNKSLRRRNINLSDLDELSGVMNEEEALIAQMMRDQGNTVDLSV